LIVGDVSEISRKVAEKGEAAAEVSNRPKPPSDDAEKLIAFMEDHYDDVVARVQSFDEFYHAIFELIE
jgi:ABC-type Fe3+-hydroxamate transport system substrate-binding protein